MILCFFSNTFHTFPKPPLPIIPINSKDDLVILSSAILFLIFVSEDCFSFSPKANIFYGK